jgi:hypothetical protein
MSTPSGTALGLLDFDGRRREQERTLATPRRRYGIAARVLFALLDGIYGRRRTLGKFKVLELVARVPYQVWEQVAYIAITHTHERPTLARRIAERVEEARLQQDNEQWHLLVIEELLDAEGRPRGWIRFFLIPQVLAFTYYQLSWLLYVIRPRWSYGLNADFEDHAEHEYAELVVEHPEWEDTPVRGSLVHEYGTFASLADLFRQIGYDERIHKEESLARADEARFA